MNQSSTFTLIFITNRPNSHSMIQNQILIAPYRTQIVIREENRVNTVVGHSQVSKKLKKKKNHILLLLLLLLILLLLLQLLLFTNFKVETCCFRQASRFQLFSREPFNYEARDWLLIDDYLHPPHPLLPVLWFWKQFPMLFGNLVMWKQKQRAL